MGRKEYEYQHLTDEMKNELDKLIKKKGKEKAYDQVRYNIWVGEISKAMNDDPYAFDVVERTANGEPYYRFQRTMAHTIKYRSWKDLPIEDEMLYYIDKKRFCNADFKDISEICMDRLLDDIDEKD